MPFQKSKYWLHIIVLIALISCEKEVSDVKLPEFKQKMVINSFISPINTVSNIDITSNRRIYGELGIIETLGNLTAFISDNTREIPLEQISSGFRFKRKDMPIKEGKTYKLRVISDKGISAEASCTVPLYRNLKIETDTFRTVYKDTYDIFHSYLKMNVSFTDYPGEDNYYRLYCEQDIYKFSEGIFYNISYFGFKNELFNDKGKNGEKSLITSINIRDINDLDSSYIKVYILNTSKSYYDYQMSLKNYSGNKDDPFAENSPVYTNVTGGLGIFAAYNVDSLIFRLK